MPQSCSPQLLPNFRKLFSKAPLQSGCPKAAMLQTCSPKLFSKAAPESCSSKLLPKAAPQSCSPALLHKVVPKAVLQSCCPKAAESCSPKLLLPEAASWSGKLSTVAPQSCYPKLFPGAAPQSCAPKLPKLFSKAVALKLRFCKPVHQNGSPKPFYKAAPESCASKLLPEAAVRSYSPKAATLQTYTPKRLPEAILQSGSRKLLPKVATESCSPKLFVKLPPKAAVLQSNCSWKVLRTACQSCFPKLLSKAIARKLRFFEYKTSPQSYSKRLPKAAPESCYWKLLPEVVCVQADRNISSNKWRTCRYRLRLAILGAQQWTAMRSTPRAPPQG